MKKIYIHIGLHKTGSTSLQSFLFKNENRFLDYGYLYPNQGRSFSRRCHHNLAWQAIKDKKYSEKLGSFQALCEEIESKKNISNVIISSEDFCKATLDEIKYIRSELGCYNIKIFVYLKRQDLRVQSVYSQMVKSSNYFDSIDKFIENVKSRYDYYSLLQPWRDVFEARNIIVRPLEKTQIKDIAIDFLTNIGICDVNNFSPINKKENISPNKSSLEVIRFVNNLLLCKYKTKLIFRDPNHQKIIKRFLDDFHQINCKDFEKNRSLISYDVALKFLKQFEISNRKVAKEYLGRDDGILFFEQPNLNLYLNSPTNINFLNNEDIQSTIIKLLKNAEKVHFKLENVTI